MYSTVIGTERQTIWIIEMLEKKAKDDDITRRLSFIKLYTF